ncbi:hypothetical protein [Pseudofrankia saprophytica]|nr:hypothetical protein [Pseudofrankia saprophytica]
MNELLKPSAALIESFWMSGQQAPGNGVRMFLMDADGIIGDGSVGIDSRG